MATALIIAGPGLMAAAIVAIAVAQVISHAWFFGGQLAGTLLFVGGLVTRMRADPVFAPLRLQDLGAAEQNGGTVHDEE